MDIAEVFFLPLGVGEKEATSKADLTKCGLRKRRDPMRMPGFNNNNHNNNTNPPVEVAMTAGPVGVAVIQT